MQPRHMTVERTREIIDLAAIDTLFDLQLSSALQGEGRELGPSVLFSIEHSGRNECLCVPRMKITWLC